MLPDYHLTRKSLWILICLLLVLFNAPEPHQPLPHAEAATFTVNSLANTNDGTCDATNCTLREAIAAANDSGGADVINFDAALAGDTVLPYEQHSVTDDVTINGSDVILHNNSMSISSGVNVTLNDLTFYDGFYPYHSGAIENEGILTINNTNFINNSISPFLTTDTSAYGGAIHNNGTIAITSSTFIDNDVGSAGLSHGGAIYNTDLMTITSSIFSENYAGTDGGAIYNSGVMTITGSTFNNNFAGEWGGAIENTGTLTISDSTFNSNTTDLDGGAIANFSHLSDILTITNSTFNGNSAGDRGGAIYHIGDTVTVTDSTFSGNTADYNGGAIYNDVGSTVMITSSSFSGNTALMGGTLYNNDSINVASSLMVDGDCLGNPITDLGNNLSFDAANCPGTVADPGLGPLQNNGGPTDTMLPALNGPAVDVYAAPCATSTDQRGISRPQGSGCDIGATEQVGTTTSLAVTAVCMNENLDVTITAGDGPFNVTASAGVNTPVNGVSTGTTTINGPEKWDNLTVTETAGNIQSVNLGQFRCRSTERPVPVSPAHLSRITDRLPTFSWTGITNAINYRIFVFDDANPATRTVDIRQKSGGPISMQLTTPLPDGRLFWRVRGRQNRVWSFWSIRFTLFKDPPPPITVNTPVPTIDLNPRSADGSAPTPAPTIPAPPNSR